MRLFRLGTHFDFISKKKFTLWISTCAILLSLGSLLYHGGLRYGVDFAGGLLVQIRFAKRVDISEVRGALEEMGFKDANVQNFGGENEFLIEVRRTSENLEEAGKSMQASLQERFKEKGLEIRRFEAVGPRVGMDLKTKAMWAVGLAFLGILIYVAFRFHQFAYGLGGIVALFHDIIVTYGAISILNLEYTLSLLAVILTIIGFSINDTIVIFDRVRENIKKMRKEDLLTIFNISINETLERTLLTTGTVMLVILILFFFGGDVIHEFTTALIVGLVTGTYSTVYIASPVVLFWEGRIKAKRRLEMKSVTRK
jgi:preprotein translocase subunit SecF